MKIYYYRAIKRIDNTALLEFVKKEATNNKNITIELFDVIGVVYLCTSHKGLLKKVDELYPNVFRSAEPPPREGNVLFTNS